MQEYWRKQSRDKPLFPDLIWSRPENLGARGKLLIIGGNSFGFAAPGQAYGEASSAGAGSTRVLLPLAVKKVAGAIIPHVEFAASTPSGSFSQEALGEWLIQAAWADGVLLAGDLGHNSETAIVLEQFLGKFRGPVTLTQDAAEYILTMPKVLDRSDTLLVLTMGQLQKLAVAAHYHVAFKLGMDLLNLVEELHNFSLKFPAHIIVKHLDKTIVASAGQVSSTGNQDEQDMWRIATAAHASVWWLQNTSRPFEAMTTSLVQKA